MGQDLDAISPFRFAAPLAPAMAAVREGKRLDVEAVVEFCRKAASGPEDILLIEGVGGVMVPLAPDVTVLDWIQGVGCPAILVTGSYLGSLSHTLTALAVLRAAAVPVAGVVVSESAEHSIGPEEIVAELKLWTDVPLIALPRIAGPDPWRRAPQLTALADGSVRMA
jgi:dethiobiotin synthetase